VSTVTLPDHYEDAVYDGEEDTGLGKPAEARLPTGNTRTWRSGS
jgi:hypothetical protein